jgi:hypothetical protein
MRKAPAVAVLVVLALTLATLAYWPPRGASAADPGGGGARGSLRVGQACKVYLRGDAAGQAAQSYVASAANNASVAGTIAGLDEGWLVLTTEKKELHIPRGVVLMIEVAK